MFAAKVVLLSIFLSLQLYKGKAVRYNCQLGGLLHVYAMSIPHSIRPMCFPCSCNKSVVSGFLLCNCSRVAAAFVDNTGLFLAGSYSPSDLSLRCRPFSARLSLNGARMMAII
ncbi:hypothetical protein GQ54DRAFT_33363 [Martensiomyces pterosporus]|nr:hypothetical protein GQ54DRAFT_33363 [Martensiomyces pterosporus]